MSLITLNGGGAVADFSHKARQRLPSESVNLQSALNALRIVRVDASRGDRIDAFAIARADGPTEASRFAIDLATESGSASGKSARPENKVLKYSMVPPTSSGRRPRWRISSIRRSAWSRNWPVEKDFDAGRRCRSDDEAHRARSCERRLRRADVHAAVYQRRIDADDFAAERPARAGSRVASCPMPSAPSSATTTGSRSQLTARAGTSGRVPGC